MISIDVFTFFPQLALKCECEVVASMLMSQRLSMNLQRSSQEVML